MATVTAKLTITSANLLSQSLNLTATSTATASHTTGLARAAVTSTAQATASGQVTVRILTYERWGISKGLYSH